MNPSALILTESALLLQLPTTSRIVSPSQRVFIKHQDGVWWNWANGAPTNRYLQPAHVLPTGSQAFFPNEQQPCYVKHINGNWFAFNPPSTAFSPINEALGQPAAAPLEIITQNQYRSGGAPVDQVVIQFNVAMSDAERGHVPDVTDYAFVGQLAAQEKAFIRFGLQYVESSGYRSRQHNLQRYGSPVTRGRLAMSIAEEVRRVMAALEEIGRPLSLPGGRRVAFEDLVLVDIRRMSRGSLQPTLATRSA